MKLSPTLLAAIIGLSAPCVCAADPVMIASASTSWEDNITRCPDPDAARSAALYDITGSAEWRNQLNRDVALQFEADAGVETCPRYDGLDRMLAGVELSVRRKFGLGPLAPAFRAGLSFTGSSYRESFRNSTRLIAGLSWTKRWDESWQTVLAAEFLRNDGRAHVYDYQNQGLSFEVRYDLSERWQLAAGVRRQWGDQVTYAWLGGSGALYPYGYETWKNSTDVSTYGPNWNAYTIDAHADSYWFSISPALDGNRSLPLRFEETAVVGKGESYRTRLISLSFVQRF